MYVHTYICIWVRNYHVYMYVRMSKRPLFKATIYLINELITTRIVVKSRNFQREMKITNYKKKKILCSFCRYAMYKKK